VVKGHLQDIISGSLIDTLIFDTGSYTVQNPSAIDKLKLTLIYNEQVPTNVELFTPNMFELFENHLNPFNPSTTIEFALPEESKVSLNKFNMFGELLFTLVD